MAIFSDFEVKLKLNDIKDIEDFVGLNLPKEYRQHLLEYNGGRCTPNIFEYYENDKLTRSCIDWFLAIYNGKYDNLIEYIKIYKLNKKRLPFQILPIAHDPGGNLICISCGFQDEGYVYFWDHENEVDYSKANDLNYSNLYIIAKGFNDFINGLKEA